MTTTLQTLRLYRPWSARLADAAVSLRQRLRAMVASPQRVDIDDPRLLHDLGLAEGDADARRREAAHAGWRGSSW